MRNGAGLIGLCGLMLSGRTASARQAKPVEVPEGLVGSPAFAKRVKVTCPGLAVGELLDQLSATTGVKLQADKAIADDKVVLFCPARPLKETLTDLAALFHDSWRHIRTAGGEDRYILLRTRQSTEYEQSLSRATYARLIAKLEEQVKALSETPDQLAKRPAEDPIRKSLEDPGNRVATTVYAALSPDQRAALFDRRVLNFSPAEIGPQLAGPIGELYKKSAAQAARFRGGEGSPPGENAQDYARRGIQFALHNCGGKFTPSIYAYGKSSMIGFLFADVDTHAIWALGPHGNPYSPAPIARSLALPSSEITRKAQGETSWVDQLQKLAESTGSVVLADFYRSCPVNLVSKEAPEPAPAAGDRSEVTALDRLCWKEGYLWWTRPGGALLFRKRDWFEQQRYEVPDRWLVETVKRMKAQKHIPKVSDFLRARELTARQILGLNGMNTGDGFSYSEFETVGASELAAFLNRELAYHPAPLGQPPIAGRSLEPGRSFEKAFFTEDTAALASNEAFVSFLSAQASPIPVADIRYFQADIYNEDRGGGPNGGWKDASVVVNWKVGPLMDKRQNICLPFELRNDRRDQVKIVVE
ncbi:MAG: hypothetical protein JWN14_959 [Chthonomonadales bacterium]|nr:hypothetical protein [Chthonomonadales bacterium]